MTEQTARAEETQRPPVPEPMEVNDVLIVTVGTVLFAAAFLVMLPFHTSLEHAGHGRWPWIALAGALLGLVGTNYCRRRAVRIKAHKDGAAAE
ncbi:MAG TPA: DUF2530 domain-containing protein [Actinocrinis sp.]